MDNEKIYTDTKLRLENMVITKHTYNPDGSKSMILQEDTSRQAEVHLDKDDLKQVLEENDGGGKMTTINLNLNKLKISAELIEDIEKIATVKAKEILAKFVANETQSKIEPEVKVSNSISVKIYMAGDYDQARKVINDHCFRNGLCVNLVKNTYIYSAGEEVGFIAELINYPRFEKKASELEEQALVLAKELRQQLNQDSFTIQTLRDDYSPTKFYSWRHLRSKS